MNDALKEIAAERQRQLDKEGWTLEHDDQHTDESLAMAAGCYANPFQIAIDGEGVRAEELPEDAIPIGWPESWDYSWWKPSDRRSDLVKAGALIVAEIERLDRAEDSAVTSRHPHD